MWHGAQTDARATMRPLAERVADHGHRVVVPDWDSHAADRGFADLLGSLGFVRERRSELEALVLVGWSLGGAAAAGATFDAARLGLRLAGTVCLAGAFMAIDPISGEHLPDRLEEMGTRPPFTLLHGVHDDVVPVDVTRKFAAMLREHSWPVELVELATDHGAIAGAAYDRTGDRYMPESDPQALLTADSVASHIASTIALQQD